MLLVTDAEVSRPSDLSQLIVVARANERFVTTMRLPEFEMTLHFAVPDETR